MMSRRLFMARASAAIDELAAQLALEPSERADVDVRVARYNRECGCALGGVFMVAAFVAVFAYIAVTGALTIGVFGASIAFVLVSSLLGKVLGLAVASVRLELLRRSLSRRARRLQEESHVYVH
jgi:hypothetical protein